MGLAICCCCACPCPVHSHRTPQKLERKKRKAVLLELERFFEGAAGADKMLTQEELVELWRTHTMRHHGQVSNDQVELIRQVAQEYFRSIDLDQNGLVSYLEFGAFVDSEMEDQGALKAMRKSTAAEIKANPGKLAALVDEFRAWDKNGDGSVSQEELEGYILALVRILTAKEGEGNNPGEEDEKAAARAELSLACKLKEELLQVADVDGSGYLDMWEAVAWITGRRKTPVELLTYDVSGGRMSWLSPLLMGRSDIEALHTSVLVYGSEWCFLGGVMRGKPPTALEVFGEPLRTSKGLELAPSEVRPEFNVVKMGHTFVTQEEFVTFLKAQESARFTPESYDLITHNCNTFSDEALVFLVGRGVPDHVMELTRIALSPMVKALRPYLNKYLNCFSMQEAGGDHLWDDVELKGSIPPPELMHNGAIVVLDAHAAGLGPAGTTVVGSLLSEGWGHCEVRVIDPDTHTLATKRVPSSAIQTRVDSLTECSN